jgi:uncharacterized protein
MATMYGLFMQRRARTTVVGVFTGVAAVASLAAPRSTAASGGRSSTTAQRPATTTRSSVAPTTATGTAALRLVAAARSQVGVTTGYDPSYVAIAYPGGDVPITTGVCTDVLIRAFRQLDIDLQVKIHEDMKSNFSAYPKSNLKRPDTNIDHRRVPNIATYFTRRGYAVPVTDKPADYLPGDVVWLKIPVNHTGIVSDRKIEGRPLLIHNVGQGAQEEDVLFAWKIVGHYRPLR